jgi:hypothetical protein
MKDDECNYSHSKSERKNFSPPTTSHHKSVTVTNKTGYEASKPLETTGYSPSTPSDSHPSNSELVARMARIESRLVQLMIHQGLDPYKKVYE